MTRRERAAKIAGLLEELKEPYRDVIVCRILDGHTTKEIAQKLEMSPETVHVTLWSRVGEVARAAGAARDQVDAVSCAVRKECGCFPNEGNSVMPASEPADPHAESAARRAAEALSAFLDARSDDPEVAPDNYAPADPSAAEAFWNAVEGFGALCDSPNAPSPGADQAPTVAAGFRPGRGVPVDARSGEPLDADRRIGSYRIIKVLGRGGMGVVYEAEQSSPHRAVALKVIRGGTYVDEHHVKLFQREIQALARLKHPFIGAIYEAGRTDDGQHFFAMELVRGRPLSEYLRAAQPSIRERLALFCKICEALNYAHQRGVMHRDLKPSNILIDNEGNPKILDFGLAKITDADIVVTTVATEVGKIQGTLPYMSPEQARGNPDEIDLRSDVYSLGVVLYELLTDQLPYDVNRALLHEAVRVICEEPPRRPSTISRTLRGDLETIALKALEKEPRRRYQSASALSEDIERYLTNQPIQARPPSAIYQFRKLVARHKAPAAFAGALFLVILGFGIWMSVLYADANRLRREAEQERSAAVAAEREQSRARQEAEAARDAEAEQRRIAEVAEREQNRAREEAELARKSEEEQRQRAEQREKEATEARAEAQARAAELETVTEFQRSMLSEIDAEQMGRALFADLRARVRESLEAEELSPEEIDSAVAVFNQTLRRANATDAALKLVDEQVLSRAVKAIEADFADQPLVRAALQQTVASVYEDIGLYPPALPLQEAALRTRRAELGDDHPHTLTSISNMGLLLKSMGEYEEALGYCREALDGRRRVLGDDHPDTLSSINNMGYLLQSMGKFEEALGYYREALEGYRRVLGDDHPFTLTSINNMGYLLQSMGKFSEAEPYTREAMEGWRRVLGDDHPDTLSSINNMGALLDSMGKLEEAEPYYREALEGRRRVLGDDHPSTLSSINNMGALLDSMGKLEEAEPYYREALEGRRRVLGDDHPSTLSSIHNLGRLLRGLGRLEEAEALAAEAVERARRSLPEGHWHTAIFLGAYGRTLSRLERYTEAEAALLEAQGTLEAVLGANHEMAIKAIELLIDLYDAWHEAEPGAGYDAQAAEWRAMLPAASPAASPQPASQPTTLPASSEPGATPVPCRARRPVRHARPARRAAHTCWGDTTRRSSTRTESTAVSFLATISGDPIIPESGLPRGDRPSLSVRTCPIRRSTFTREVRKRWAQLSANS